MIALTFQMNILTISVVLSKGDWFEICLKVNCEEVSTSILVQVVFITKISYVKIKTS